MLDDITAVKTWSKVNEGMVKMYDAEVLGKLPVMQHALFGTLLPFPSPEEDPELRKALEEEGPIEPDVHGHVHADKGWAMDCCGIPGESLIDVRCGADISTVRIRTSTGGRCGRGQGRSCIHDTFRYQTHPIRLIVCIYLRIAQNLCVLTGCSRHRTPRQSNPPRSSRAAP